MFVSVDRSPYAGFRLLPCHYTMKEGERGPFFPKLRVRIKDNNSSPHGKFYRFLLPFSCKFPDLNFASYVLYIYLCGTHSEPWSKVVGKIADISLLLAEVFGKYHAIVAPLPNIRCWSSSGKKSHHFFPLKIQH